MFETVFSLFLTKLLPVFVYPLGLTLSLGAIGGLCWRFNLPRLARSSLGAAMMILWVCSTPVFAKWAIASLERQYPPRTIAETPHADAAIVLGGALGLPVRPRTSVDLSETSDRVLHAARLYRAGKVKHILVSGGNLPWSPTAKPEAELVKELLVEWGVAAEAVELGTESRNTYENAREVESIWKARGFKSALLVTSATHMPRALATFRHAGLPVIASTTDVLAVDNDRFDPFEWLPNASALVLTTHAVNEWIGYLAYKVRGYL